MNENRLIDLRFGTSLLINKFSIYIFCIIFFVNTCYAHSRDDTTYIKVSNKFAQLMKKEHGMELSCIGGGSQNGIPNLISIGFKLSSRTIITKSEARKLVMKCADTFINMINQNQQLVKDHGNVFFNYKNLKIRIIFYDKDGHKLFHPILGFVTMSEGKLIFGSNDPDSYAGGCWITESTDEAIEKIKNGINDQLE